MSRTTTLLLLLLFLVLAASPASTADNKTESNQERRDKALSVFNVVTFPNTVCAATSGYNGTCYTASECTSLGGAASGTCASSFGVCCVFSIACGGSTSANNSYAIISSYSVSTDADPCTYTFCKTNSDVCKLRIDFDSLVLDGPAAMSATPAITDSPFVGDCSVDSLTVGVPGGQAPPTICGYNTGQHMFVSASDLCNTVNIDIDTGTTTTTRSWQIKVTQYECGNQMSPEQDCLQFHTATTGTIASFNWDTSATTVALGTHIHLSSQFYDICIRRARSSCSVCYSAQVLSAITGIASSYGVGASSLGPAQTSAAGSFCSGITTLNPALANTVGNGDYLEIANMQHSTSAIAAIAGTLGVSRLCGAIVSIPSATTQASVCSFSTPFKVGVHFDANENIGVPGTAASPNFDHTENDPAATTGAGFGTSGFYLAYWQNSC